jgi:hypothetical protein
MKTLGKNKHIILKFWQEGKIIFIISGLHRMLDQWQVLWFPEVQVLRSNPGKGPSVSAQTEPVFGRKKSIAVSSVFFFSLKKGFSFE